MRFPLVLLFAVPLALSPLKAQVSAPSLGNVRYSGGSVRAVYGLDANFAIGPAWTTAAAASFSNEGGLLASSGKIQLIKHDGSIAGEYATAEPKPLLGIDGGLNTAVAWLPSSGTLMWWTGSAFSATHIAGELPGIATSVQSDGATATLLVTAPEGSVLRTSVELATGDIVSVNVVPGAQGPAFAQGQFIVFRSDRGLAIEQPNGDIRTLSFSAQDLEAEHMSSDWLHIHSSNRHQDWALHLNASVCTLSQLPVPATSQEAGK